MKFVSKNTFASVKPFAISGALFAGISMGLTSCMAPEPMLHSHTSRSLTAQQKSIIVQPSVVDLKVDLSKRITGEGNAPGLEAAQQAALYDAMQKHQADAVVEPIFVAKTMGSRQYVTVNGYAAKYSNPRSLTDAAKEVSSVDTVHFQKVMRYMSATPSGEAKPAAGGLLPGFLGGKK